MMENNNRLEEIVNIELEGISRTILEYSTDQFITSYAEKLCKDEFKNNPVFLKSLVDRIKKWYEKNYDEIQKSQYVQHKDLHRKSYEIILELSQLIEKLQ